MFLVKTSAITGQILSPLTGDKLVKYVVVAFFRALRTDARFLQQIMGNMTADDARRGITAAAAAEVDLDELAEATGIIVAYGFGVAERLQNWVRLDDALKNRRGQKTSERYMAQLNMRWRVYILRRTV